MAHPRRAPAEVPGLAARRVAADILDGVLRRHRPLDEQLEGEASPGLSALSERDRALTRKLVAPAWLMARWSSAYGRATARAIAAIHGEEPPLDLTVKDDPAGWAARLRGRVVPTGTVRTVAHGPVSLLPGYVEGAWWVQDAA